MEKSSHQSLYRAYRPKSFAEVAGQDQVTKVLAEQIATAKVGHAYLFAGSRGLGKTSIARIFARELGCTERDLYEIDAASNNSVDDIRALTENVYTLPFESPYKVYILDEAHMLSKGAWNAFLKTLEEPPAHVIFILATTELSKVPETVLSRCQVFEFKKPKRQDLSKFVETIVNQEEYAPNKKFKIDRDAADLIALLAEGSYRDALSIAEKTLRAEKKLTEVFGSESEPTPGRISLAWVEEWTGAPKRALVLSLATALHEGDTEAALKTVRKVGSESVDMGLYLSMELEFVRTVLLVRYAPELRKEIAEEQGADSYAEIEKLAAAKDSKLTHVTLKVLLDATERMRFSPVPSLPLELAILELAG